MAETDRKQQTETSVDQEQKLKYLDFVQAAAIQAIVCFTRFYDFAKENSGPLKSGVQTVEGTVKTVIGPVYEKFHDVPFELLKFVDRKVDESLGEVERYVPSVVKTASSRAFVMAQKAPEAVRAVASEVQRVGVVDTAAEIVKTAYDKFEPVAKEMYDTYEPVAEQYAVSAWQTLNRLPLFPQVAHIVVPTAAYWSEKYNQVVYNTVEKGYTVSLYLPLIPTERIAKVFGGGGDEEMEESVDGTPTVDDVPTGGEETVVAE